MKYIITDDVFRMYPSFYRGVIICKDINIGDSNDIILGMLRQSEQGIRSDATLNELAKYPFIENWRTAHKAFGSNPKKYRPSIESLIRRVRGGNDIPYINTLVALFNYISLKYRIPCGGDDLDQIIGDPCLKISDGGENFTPFNSPGVIEKSSEGEVIYADDVKVMCRKWNWRQGDQTKITLETKNVIINVDGLAPITRATINDATMELANLLRQYCGGDITYKYLSPENQIIEI